jgi:hypothetical protein
VERKAAVAPVGLQGVVPEVPMSQMQVVLVEVVVQAILVEVVAKEDPLAKRVVVVAPRQATLVVWSKVAPVVRSQTHREQLEALLVLVEP